MGNCSCTKTNKVCDNVSSPQSRSSNLGLCSTYTDPNDATTHPLPDDSPYRPKKPKGPKFSNLRTRKDEKPDKDSGPITHIFTCGSIATTQSGHPTNCGTQSAMGSGDDLQASGDISRRRYRPSSPLNTSDHNPLAA
jgi:hypothetical protein